MSQDCSSEEAARLINVHPNTIVRWIKSGKLPSSKFGREYRIPRDAIDNRVKRAAPGPRIIAVANQKRGVAKTTSTLNLAAGLAQRGRAFSWLISTPRAAVPKVTIFPWPNWSMALSPKRARC